MEMSAANLSLSDEILPLASALGYGVVLAAKSGRHLCLTGDISAWDEQWGRLVPAGPEH